MTCLLYASDSTYARMQAVIATAVVAAAAGGDTEAGVLARSCYMSMLACSTAAPLSI